MFPLQHKVVVLGDVGFGEFTDGVRKVPLGVETNGVIRGDNETSREVNHRDQSVDRCLNHTEDPCGTVWSLDFVSFSKRVDLFGGTIGHSSITVGMDAPTVVIVVCSHVGWSNIVVFLDCRLGWRELDKYSIDLVLKLFE